MYFADHNPPHFHVIGRDGEALVKITTLEIFEFRGCVDSREALVWATGNRAPLAKRWAELRGGS